MFTLVHLCLPLFTSVSYNSHCLLVHVDVFLPMFTRVFTYVYHCLLEHFDVCSTMFARVYLCLHIHMFTRFVLNLCLHLFTYVYLCLLEFTYAYSCLRINHVYSFLHM